MADLGVTALGKVEGPLRFDVKLPHPAANLFVRHYASMGRQSADVHVNDVGGATQEVT